MRNDPRPGVWRNRREEVEELAAADPRVKIVEKTEEEAARDYADGSVDAVWLDADHSWRGMTASLERWWPKVREGGMLAGAGCRNAFEGNSRELYTWAVSQKVLETWTAARGLALIRGRDAEKSWAIFKNTPPRPEDITVITGFTRNVDYADVTTENHRLYCERHGYRYRTFGDADFARDRAYCWGKVDFARRALEASPWVFWIDVDAIFNRLDVKLERLCWPAFSLISGLWETPQGARPSLGTFLVQAKPETEELLKAVWEWPGNRYDGAHEEDAIYHVLRAHPEWRHRVMCINCSEINSRPPHQDWTADDPILHFLEIRGTRRAVLEDACRMARERPEGRPDFRAETRP